MKKTYTIEEIKNYLQSQDSFGDALYNLNEENIDKANQVADTFDDEEYTNKDSEHSIW